MAIHTFTDEQMQKFLKAVGVGNKPDSKGGEFSTDQLRKLIQENNGGQNWPAHTYDPQVNYAVDCAVQTAEQDVEFGEPVYDEEGYLGEIEASKKAFGPR